MAGCTDRGLRTSVSPIQPKSLNVDAGMSNCEAELCYGALLTSSPRYFAANNDNCFYTKSIP
jgi:hypothetical protein